MQFGVNTWAWESPLTTTKFEQLAPTVAEMGFDIIEISLTDLDLLDFDRMATILSKQDLEISGVPIGFDLVHSDEAVRANGIEFLKQCIQGMSTMEGQHLGVPMAVSEATERFEKSTQERNNDLDNLVEGLTELSSTAAAHDIVLGIEPLNRFETSLINTTDEAIEIIDRVDNDACQLLLDPFHMNIEEKDLCEAIRAAGPRLTHFHACANDRGTPGSGHLPWEEMAATFGDIGFDGSVVIETFTPYEGSIARPEGIWRPLAPTQDEIVEDGLEFLEETLR